jgi:hypothetical protein
MQNSELVRKAGFMVITLRQSNNPPSGKAQNHRDRKKAKAKERVGDCYQRIHPGRPNSQFHTLL